MADHNVIDSQSITDHRFQQDGEKCTSETNLVANFEKAFCDVVKYMSHPNGSKNTAELAVDAGDLVDKFLSEGKRVEQFFLRKRLEANMVLPEVFLDEEMRGMREDLLLRNRLLQRHEERLVQWSAVLHRVSPQAQLPFS